MLLHQMKIDLKRYICVKFQNIRGKEKICLQREREKCLKKVKDKGSFYFYLTF